jgi:hypothetical protein
MALQRKTVLRGITEVGAKRTAVDVSFGKTTPDGAEITFESNELEVESGQSAFLEDIFNSSERINIRLRLLFADLVNVKEVLGLPDSALTGDLSLATPEVLNITAANLLGTREDALYLLSPGPGSMRRFDFHRTKVRASPTFTLSKDNNVILEGVWAVLRPSTGNVVTITDSP